MALLPVITFIHLMHTSGIPVADDNIQAFTSTLTFTNSRHATAVPSLMERVNHLLRPLIPWTVPLWLLGVCAAMLRVVRGWHHAYRIRISASFIPLDKWYSVVSSLCVLFGINKIVRLAVSNSVTVPSVVGWLKPVILIPPSTLAGLTPLQMELILAHELAHIRRQDYLWNLMQLLVETLLFYHPVVHWISQHGRLEREQCCDDMVIEKHGNTLEYARALTELESLRHAQHALLLGANGGQVLNRIRRLLGVPINEAPVFWLPMMLITGILISTSVMQFNHQTAAIQSILSTRYSLLADKQRFDAHLPMAARDYKITPTQVRTNPVNQSRYLRSVNLLDMPTIVLKKLPSLAKASNPVETISNPPKLPIRRTPKQSITPGSIIEKHAPVYPALAQERGIEGFATIEFNLTAGGEITDMRVTHVSGSSQFGQAAMDALRQWKISPATLEGVPVSQRMKEEFIFQLKPPTANNGTCKIPVGYHVCQSNR
jgi:bla regulator protein blaR1